MLLSRAILISLAAILLNACGDSVSENNTNNSINVNDVVVTASGYLESTDVATISSPNVYRVYQYKLAFLAPEGSYVKRGDLIVSFDDSQIRQNLSRVENRLAQEQERINNRRLDNKSRLEELKLQLAEKKAAREKSKFILDGALISEGAIAAEQRKLELDIANNEVARLEEMITIHQKRQGADIDRLERRVQRNQYQISELKKGLQQLEITAPKEGILVYRTRRNRNKPTVGDNLSIAEPIIDIPSLEKMRVVAEIQESDINRIAVGSDAEVVLETLPDRSFRGRVVALGKAVRQKNANQPNKILDAYIDLVNTDADVVRPGMTARIKIFPEANTQSIDTVSLL